MQLIENGQQAKENQAYYKALAELLYQLADDDFLLAHRGSEWLGLAPHIEEDVAFSSISQDTMGHAAMYYQLLEELGEGDADYLAHGRKASERKNAILLELKNGTGTYLEEPRYDWAFTVVRNYFYDTYKKIKLDSLKSSSYVPLRNAAVKISMEQYYHIMHWSTWFKQLTLAKGEARERMKQAIGRVWDEFQGVLTLGVQADEMAHFHLIDREEKLTAAWISYIIPIFSEVKIDFPGSCGMKLGNGREGIHTKDLEEAIDTLSVVYASDTNAVW
ncbi:ring-1,2-phenylacetyl-CoA epoxidase subunit PaaC [Bacillus oleivorans]|uniref:Ring-1,2-phenylacetyl-CoA epoxidase subunit PaaC n=1 Tax=Bacillus oleivorans TaxID=1448271 RepID=A0A285CQV4_9BACI|nr:1,2-phenylacetyl-CoA epoxidase subunit PaaC [Bacillus oleivorans]SNX69901.1 ring-1,2-phenylacetyl-CoA epoxidase subunit PaaC [Bacillus oleivorans]